MSQRKFVDVGHLGFRNLAGEDTTNALAARMHVQHDRGRTLTVQVEERLQYGDHEIHWREVVVEQNHLVERRTHHLRARLLDGEAMRMFGVLIG